MNTLEACKALDAVRGDAIVVCTMGAMNAIDKLPMQPLTMACVPLMGGAASIGLGLALARPERKVFVLDGDASLFERIGVLPRNSPRLEKHAECWGRFFDTTAVKTRSRSAPSVPKK